MPTGEFRVHRPSGASFAIPAEPAGLPVQLTTFVGREREIAAIAELLRSTRLLTLTGAGGAGKTRLALEVGAQVADRFPDLAWVDLAPLADPELVPQVVASALGFREEAGRTELQTLVAGLRERPQLLILDNCEHLVDACGSLASTLLTGCPQLRILATSRAALGVSGEQAWLVPPLTLPQPERADAIAVANSEAGRLFLDRARSVVPAFTLDDRIAPAVARICHRLDGIPLAIELAAARVRVLAPDQIAARLEDSFRMLAAPGRSTVPRHRTLEEAIDWSHELLSDAEAALFRRLAVFAGSFSLDAVEAICPKPPVTSANVLDLLSALVDKSMVVMETAGTEARYRLLETLRRYGKDKLVGADEEAEFRERHAGFFVALVSAAERPTFGGGSQGGWRDRLIADDGNIRATIEWAQHEDPTGEAGLKLGAGLHWHWFSRGQFREGRRQLSEALERGRQASAHSRAKALCASAAIAFWIGEHDAIRPAAEEAVMLLRDEDDPWHLAYALTTTGMGISVRDPAAALPLLAEAVTTARTQGPSILLAFALYWQARLWMAIGELDKAKANLEECQAMGVSIGHGPAVAHPLTMLGLLEVERGEIETGGLHLFESLELHIANSDVLGVIWVLEGLARLAARIGKSERSPRLLGAALAERERIGAAWSDRERRDFDRLRTELRQTLGDERFESSWSSGSSMAIDDAARIALTEDRGAMTPATPPAADTEAREAPEESAHTLDVRALGELEIRIDGEPLARDAWSSARPRELLLLLLCYPNGRTREQVGVAFWPEASSEQVRNNFHVTMHRLRKTLGDPAWVVLEGDRYTINAEVAIRFDALRFERELPGALRAFKADGDASVLEPLLADYRGDFLEHENAGDWHLELRDRLRYLYLDTMRTLGKAFVARERWHDATDVYRRLIARDALDESAYRELMRCHARLGERHEAMRVYQRLEQILRKELEAEPDPETTAIYRQIKEPVQTG